MKLNIITTNDGSHSLEIEGWNESYHSKIGAIKEAYYIYINSGLSILKKKHLRILEVGFGTGLNTFITLLEATKQQLKIHYESVEAFPLSIKYIPQLNYPEKLGLPLCREVFEQLHILEWNKLHTITPYFSLKKRLQSIEDITTDQEGFDLIYFDAFCERVQPQLWTEAIFKKMYRCLNENGMLLTYASKTSVQNILKTIGFYVEKLVGPNPKQDMIRAFKNHPKNEKNEDAKAL